MPVAVLIASTPITGRRDRHQLATVQEWRLESLPANRVRVLLPAESLAVSPMALLWSYLGFTAPALCVNGLGPTTRRSSMNPCTLGL